MFRGWGGGLGVRALSSRAKGRIGAPPGRFPSALPWSNPKE